MHHSLRRFLAVRACAVAIATALGAAPALAQDDDVVATLNGQPITEADLALAEAELDPQFNQLPEDQRRAAALSAVIDVRLFAAEAEKQKIDQDADFQHRLEFLRQRALHSAFIDQNVVQPITDDDVHKRYDAEVAKITPPEEVHARHILVDTEEEAKAIIEQLNAGGDFAEIAKEKSKDGAAANGGDLGYFTKGRMVPEFETAAFAMESGSYSKEPIKTQFGWHVLKVDDKRQQPAPTLEQVSDEVRSVIVREKYVATLKDIRGKADVNIPDAELKASVDKLYQQQTGEAGEATETPAAQ